MKKNTSGLFSDRIPLLRRATARSTVFGAVTFWIFCVLFTGTGLAASASMQTASASTGAFPQWDQAVGNFVKQIVSQVPSGKTATVGVVDFKEMRHNRVTDFSARFKEDFLAHLARFDGVQYKAVDFSKDAASPYEAAREAKLDYFVRGFFRNRTGGLDVWSQLVDAETGRIVSSESTRIAGNAIAAPYLAMLDTRQDDEAAYRAFGSAANYEDALEDLLRMKPMSTDLPVKIWTEKTEYKIGDTIKFFVKAERPCYLVLFDVSPNGDTTVIFPNADSQNNFLVENVTYQIPPKDSGVVFKVQGPTGLERFKAIVSLTPGLPLDLKRNQRFYTFDKNSPSGSRDIQYLVKTFSDEKRSQWGEASMEILIQDKPETFMRGKGITLVDKPKKPMDIMGTMGKEETRPGE